MQDDEGRAKTVIDRHRKVIGRWVDEHGGRTLQFYGDGTLSVFPSAVNAAEGAVAIQKDCWVRCGSSICSRWRWKSCPLIV